MHNELDLENACSREKRTKPSTPLLMQSWIALGEKCVRRIKSVVETRILHVWSGLVVYDLVL